MTPAERLEAERYVRVVREYQPEFDQQYLDLLAIADAQIRATDETEERSA